MNSPESPYGASSVATPPAPISDAQPRRKLGITSLVLALIPYVVLIVFVVITIVAGAMDETGWAILGWAIFGAYVSSAVGFILGGTALGLGIAAAVKNRGRGAGIAGAVIGGLTLLLLLSIIASIVIGAF